MGVRYPSVFTTAGLGVYGAAGAEFIHMTLPPLTLPLDSSQVLIHWYTAFNVGAGTTAVTVRIRRGTTLTGAVVNTGVNVNTTASTVAVFSGCFVDTPGAVAGQQYSLTLAGTGTSGAGAGQENAMFAYAL